jgi:chromosomal replication initiator protein
VTSEKFTNELINAIKDDKNIEFRARYRSVDLLLLDDVQFISRKERTQEEFFHTFNTLYDAEKQIVIASDKKPSEIPLLDERLRSRFEWGLTADIQAPDFETRIAILRKKARLQDIIVPDDIITYIAENIPFNIRLLEGALNRVIAYASLTDYDLSRNIAEEALKSIITGVESREITQDVIIDAICKYFDLRDDSFVSSKKRDQNTLYPRQIAMYLCRELIGMSLPSIATLFGGKNHTTVMHSIKKVNEEILTSGDTKRLIDNLISDIKGPPF